MARTIKLDLNDDSEAALQWAVERWNVVHSQDKDFAPLDIEGWVKRKAAEVVDAQKREKIEAAIAVVAEQMRKDAGL